MSKWYKVTVYTFSSPKITSVEVERFSKHYVWIGGRRYQRESNFESYYQEWKDARLVIIRLADSRAQSLRKELENANTRLSEALALPLEAPQQEGP
jgi:hypothetical protein